MIKLPLQLQPTYSFLTRFERNDMTDWTKVGYSMSAFPMLFGAKVNVVNLPTGEGYEQEERFFTSQDLYYCFLNVCWSAVLAKTLSMSGLDAKIVVASSALAPWVIGLIILQLVENQEVRSNTLKKHINDFFKVRQGYANRSDLEPLDKQTIAFEQFAILTENDESQRNYCIEQCKSQATLFQCLYLLKHKKELSALNNAVVRPFNFTFPNNWKLDFLAPFIMDNKKKLNGNRKIKEFLEKFPQSTELQNAIDHIGVF